MAIQVETTVRKDVYTFFGISAQTLNDWERNGMPIERSGKKKKYDLGEITRWRRSRDLETRSASPHSQQRQKLENRKLELDTERRELELSQQKAEVVDREASKAAVRHIFTGVRNRLESLPEEICSSLDPKVRADLMNEWTRLIAQVCQQLSEEQFDLSYQSITGE